MEIESSPPFFEELNRIVNERTFKRTLVLWLHYFKRLSLPDIIDYTHIPKSTVYDIKNKWQVEGTIEDLPREGRPFELTPEEVQAVIEKQLSDRFKAATDISKELVDNGWNISYDHVKRVIRENFHKVNSPLKIKIRDENKAKRVSWIQRHLNWRKRKWNSVVWTDEKVFELYPQKGVLKAKILPDEAPDDFPRPKVQQGGQKVMFWGAVSGKGKIYLDVITESINSETYSCFLHQKALPAIRQICKKSFILQQDNAPSHRAGLTQTYLEIVRVKVLDWPPQSPDLNPIEEVWLWMATKIKTKHFNNIQELTDYVFYLWNILPKDIILSYINKLSSKMNYILEHKGEEYLDHND